MKLTTIKNNTLIIINDYMIKFSKKEQTKKKCFTAPYNDTLYSDLYNMID